MSDHSITDVFDTASVQLVFVAVKEAILHNAIKDSGTIWQIHLSLVLPLNALAKLDEIVEIRYTYS